MSKFTLFLCSLAIVSGMGYANEDESSTKNEKTSSEVAAMDEEANEEETPVACEHTKKDESSTSDQSSILANAESDKETNEEEETVA